MLNKRLFLKSTLIITAATLLSKVLGLVRQQYSLYLFGGGWEYDSFVAAFRIPNALRELLAEGALSAAFIPIFSAILVRSGKKEAFIFANKVLNISIIITFTVIIIGLVFSNVFMSYYHNPDVYPSAAPLAARLFDIMMFYLPFISLSALIMGMLNSMNQFAIPALGPFFSNVAFLAVLYFSYKLFNSSEVSERILYLSYATVIGGFTHFIIQTPSLIKSKFKFNFTIDFKDNNIKEFFTLFVPFAMAMGIPKLNNILSNIYSHDIIGGNTALSQGFFIVQLPLSVFVAGVSMVSLPNMSKYFESGDMDNLKNLILMGFRIVFFFIFPSAIGLMLLDVEISHFIFSDILLIFSKKTGKINDLVIGNIALAQFYFSPGIISMGLSIVFIRAFQSMKDMKTMIYTGIASVALHLLLMTIFISYIGLSFEGIALSITLSSFFNLILLILILLRKMGKFQWNKTFISMGKMIIATCIMAIIIYLLKEILFNSHNSSILHNNVSLELKNKVKKSEMLSSLSYIGNIIKLFIIIIAGLISYTISLFLLKEEEFKKVMDKILKKLLPQKKV
ncbi:MAG: murein biosynthesis integral membrane protein MurJ [Spirochaetota bacterium]|nr:murein biosynthesis integral membrane protein MurJ [Spirochaetota bacterium]